MKKQRRRWYTFKYHLTVEELCYPNQAKRRHDHLHKLTAQALADVIDDNITLIDCETKQFRGSVRPRR
jgi:hypothetical protein